MTFEDDSPSIACPHCGHTISAQARFCRRCGKTPKSAPPACAKCGAVAEATDALFCSGCGGALVSSATDSETKPLTVATPVRRSASVEPIPLSSLPERGARKIWPWVVGLAILAASTVAVATHRENLATWLHVLGIPQTAHSSTPPPMKAMEAAISAYYDAIGNQDFKTAYSLWTPSMQKGLTPSDLANQWYSQWLRLRANGTQVNVNLNVTMSEPPDGDFVPTTVTETEPYPDGYVRKKVLKGGWHVVNIRGRWLLNEREFKTVADNGPPPTSPANDDMGGSSQASNSSRSGESGTPSSKSQSASTADDTRIVGNWHCTADEWPSLNYTFNAEKTWTNGEEKGTYTYDDYTKDLELFDHAGEPLVIFSGRAMAIGSGLMWFGSKDYYWGGPSDMGDYDCKKGS